jgi:putative nucleotidyltransferase with HDIG domain
MQALNNYINEIKTLPAAPQVLSQLLVQLNRDETHADQIVQLIAFDPALTAKVLQRCNSAASASRGAVADLDAAVARLGFNTIYSLVALVVGESMLGAAQRGYGLGAGQLWEHSATTAVATKAVARHYGGDENLVFTAALLHDIGKLVLGAFLEDSRDWLMRETGPSGHSFLEAEKAILGVDHAEIGGRVLEQWKFPANLTAAVRFHHDPVKARPNEELASYVHLGDIIAHYLGHAEGYQSFAVRCQAEALEILEIRPREIEELILEAETAWQALDWSNPRQI